IRYCRWKGRFCQGPALVLGRVNFVSVMLAPSGLSAAPASIAKTATLQRCNHSPKIVPDRAPYPPLHRLPPPCGEGLRVRVFIFSRLGNPDPSLPLLQGEVRRGYSPLPIKPLNPTHFFRRAQNHRHALVDP